MTRNKDGTHAYVPSELLLLLREKLSENYTERYGGRQRLRYSELVKRWKAHRSIKTQPPSDDTVQNFYQAKREGFSVRLIDGLCYILLGLSLEEWLLANDKAPTNSSLNSNRDDFPAETRIGLIRVYTHKTPQDLLDKIASIKPQSTWLFGTHFGITLAQRKPVYLSMLENGSTLYFLVLNPDNEHIHLQASTLGITRQNLKRECIHALSDIISIMKMWRMKSRENPDQEFNSKIQVRLTNILPTMRAYIADPDISSGCSYFIPYMNQVLASQSPVLYCRNVRGGISQKYFEGIKKIWNHPTLTHPIQKLVEERANFLEFEDDYSMEEFMNDYPGNNNSIED